MLLVRKTLLDAQSISSRRWNKDSTCQGSGGFPFLAYLTQVWPWRSNQALGLFLRALQKMQTRPSGLYLSEVILFGQVCDWFSSAISVRHLGFCTSGVKTHKLPRPFNSSQMRHCCAWTFMQLLKFFYHGMNIKHIFGCWKEKHLFCSRDMTDISVKLLGSADICIELWSREQEDLSSSSTARLLKVFITPWLSAYSLGVGRGSTEADNPDTRSALIRIGEKMKSTNHSS